MSEPIKRKYTTTTSEGRLKYQRQYYLEHREEARAYQLNYRLTHKRTDQKSSKRTEKTAWRGVEKTVISASDFMNTPNTEKILRAILNSEIGLTV